ncbi:MAG: MltA domain-containing protein [Leptospiraceae bacterium]|nr:MltA domain-containing protein [Leptospiraceae bacterium]
MLALAGIFTRPLLPEDSTRRMSNEATRLMRPISPPISIFENFGEKPPDDLLQSVQASLNYYQDTERARPHYAYGNESYDRVEMIASMRLFLRLLNNANAAERNRLLAEHFLYFESKPEIGPALFTGYFVPSVAANRSHGSQTPIPLYYRPKDLIDVDLGQFNGDWHSRRLSGKLDADGRAMIPYETHDDIFAGALRERAEILAYLHPADFYFIQVQGSAVLEFPDGSRQAVGYAGDNGHAFQSIFPHLKNRVPFSRAHLRAYMDAHPEEQAVLATNPRYIFFRKETATTGHLHQPLTALRSIATDARLPAGGLALIDTRGSTTLRRFMLIHDRGSAITGPGRVDVFFGADESAEREATRFKQNGRLILFVARRSALANAKDL